MGSEGRPTVTKGIFHSLPTFDENIKDQTAIVTGANGISGFYTLRALLSSPERWKKIWAVSRRPPPERMMSELLSDKDRAKVEHVACDFLASPEEIAKQLKDKNVTADYVFFYSYAQPKPPPGQPAWSNAQELADTNSALLKNFFGALDAAQITPKRFVLQTGAKNYGVHIGRARTPYVESDPRPGIEPNFYYPQEDLLYDWCKKHNIGWNIICPAWIIGAVNNAAMNALHPLAVYAAVKAHKGEELDFPGDIEAWQGVGEHSTAMLTGYLTEWAALEDKCKNQKFNASDTCPLPNNRLWPALADWYGCKGVGKPELDESKLTVVDPGDKPTPLGFGPGLKSKFSFTLGGWASQKENHDAWKEIMKKHNLDDDPFEGDLEGWQFADAAAWALSLCLSMNKARYFGWTGHVDTLESLYLAYSEFNKIGMLPPLVGKSKPLI